MPAVLSGSLLVYGSLINVTGVSSRFPSARSDLIRGGVAMLPAKIETRAGCRTGKGVYARSGFITRTWRNACARVTERTRAHTCPCIYDSASTRHVCTRHVISRSAQKFVARSRCEYRVWRVRSLTFANRQTLTLASGKKKRKKKEKKTRKIGITPKLLPCARFARRLLRQLIVHNYLSRTAVRKLHFIYTRDIAVYDVGSRKENCCPV